jgi:MFS family permease
MRHRIYLLVVLVLVFAFNYADRFALGLVLGDIKADLSLSDTQLGFLSGIAFAFCYAAMGIPLARWADRGNRVNIISLAMIAWGAAVAGCGMVGSFGQLLVCRVGAGVGEAGCNPASQSLISDYYSRPERPRAFSIYLQGNTLSVIIGYFFAGWLAQHYGWRWMFVILAVPGVLLGIVVRRTLKEPRELLVEARTLSHA